MAHTKQKAARQFKREGILGLIASGNHLSAMNDEPEPMECGDLTPEQVDAEYHRLKVGGGLRKRDDRDANAADLAWLDVLRRSEAL